MSRSDVELFGLVGRSIPSEPKVRSLCAPVVRQILAEGNQPRWRQLDRLLAGEDRTHDLRREVRETDKGRQMLSFDIDLLGHGIDAVVAS